MFLYTEIFIYSVIFQFYSWMQYGMMEFNMNVRMFDAKNGDYTRRGNWKIK